MSLHEVDDLLVSSRELIQKSHLETAQKRLIIWNLENLPSHYDMDAGGFEMTETKEKFPILAAPALGKLVVEQAHQQKDEFLVYHWAAFLLNYMGYFQEDFPIQELKQNYLLPIREIFHQYDWEDYEPMHRTLEIYVDMDEEMKEWFSEEQLELMEWFVS